MFPQTHKEKVGPTVKKFIAMLCLSAFMIAISGIVGCGDDKPKTPAPAKEKDKMEPKKEK